MEEAENSASTSTTGTSTKIDFSKLSLDALEDSDSDSQETTIGSAATPRSISRLLESAGPSTIDTKSSTAPPPFGLYPTRKNKSGGFLCSIAGCARAADSSDPNAGVWRLLMRSDVQEANGEVKQTWKACEIDDFCSNHLSNLSKVEEDLDGAKELKMTSKVTFKVTAIFFKTDEARLAYHNKHAKQTPTSIRSGDKGSCEEAKTPDSSISSMISIGKQVSVSPVTAAATNDDDDDDWLSKVTNGARDKQIVKGIKAATTICKFYGMKGIKGIPRCHDCLEPATFLYEDGTCFLEQEIVDGKLQWKQFKHDWVCQTHKVVNDKDWMQRKDHQKPLVGRDHLQPNWCFIMFPNEQDRRKYKKEQWTKQQAEQWSKRKQETKAMLGTEGKV
jgi:hypothetical protein